MDEPKKSKSPRKAKKDQSPKRFQIVLENGIEFFVAADSPADAVIWLVDKVMRASVKEVQTN